MSVIYSVVIRLYFFGILCASVFNKKARLWIKGRRKIFSKISDSIQINGDIIWFHAASLGEFEQGRPLIEKIKTQKPHYKILLTFFSPSGYEIRKNYAFADYIFYLPLDTGFNARKFLKLVNPKIVVFIKYEFWFHFLKQIHMRKIPLYLISSNFRNNQVFFKNYGYWYRNLLKWFTHIFVQNKRSLELLKNIGIHQVTVSGDTRFDRVLEAAQKTKTIELVDQFTSGQKTLVCGSTWPADEELLAQFINTYNLPLKFIIAPHEIDAPHIQKLSKRIHKNVGRYSELSVKNAKEVDVLIIDNIGMLASLYKYADIAYIGGGFGAGIHNILEAAAYKTPVVFGPNYNKFQEAVDLIFLGGAFSIFNFDGLNLTFNNLLGNEDSRHIAGNIAGNYVIESKGATEKIMGKLF
ncbi:MAG: 3-deoxy-D-manno-octulosonic acid transferase [Bacteroidales bacterium]|nr:3-deoxy-D-manno-octulosonic acid transferase [Bacteroidales bacterium]